MCAKSCDVTQCIYSGQDYFKYIIRTVSVNAGVIVIFLMFGCGESKKLIFSAGYSKESNVC